MRNFIIFLLILICVFLFYLIISGTFCSCSPVKCPNNNDNSLRSYIL